MNTMRISLMALMLLSAQACKTPERTAYDIVASTQVAVDAAMNGWGDYVRAGFATQADETQVKAAYVNYQRSMEVARSAVIAYKTGVSQDKKPLDTALSTLQAAGQGIISIIAEIKKSP